MNQKPEKYVGINNDIHGGMTQIGKIIRDAWVFGFIPESETCEGWNLAGIDSLMDKVNAEWDKYGCQVSLLTDDLKRRHQRIHREAFERARSTGWGGHIEIESEE
ncbi:MAG: hypothetical protein ACE5EH_00170 [Gammaproteobacteria bacterium]